MRFIHIKWKNANCVLEAGEVLWQWSYKDVGVVVLVGYGIVCWLIVAYIYVSVWCWCGKLAAECGSK